MTSSAPMIFLTSEDSKPSHFESGAFKVLYVYTIDDGKHTGRLKVGDATFHTAQTLDEIVAESNSLNPFGNSGHYFSTPGITAAAKRRIDEQTKTADVEYTLLWSILAVKPEFEENSPIPAYVPFRDHDVHNVLKRNMISTSHHRSDKKVGEWFETSLKVVQAAVNYLQTDEMSEDFTESDETVEITLRKEQKDAVAFAKRHFKNGTVDKPKEILWSAIMRFGKTLTTYETVKQIDDIKKVLIVTHRPVVSDGWYTDFKKIFPNGSGVHFSSRVTRGETWDQVKNQTDFFYFASIQDLRGSIDEVSGKFKKNAEIFATDWDMIVTDEAHEGTSTLLAETMYGSIKAKYWLHLSGTPFNIVENFEQSHIYKWDYIDEQKARKQWAIDYPLDSNPYDSLPTIEIFTYDISENYKLYKDASTLGFDFGKFFKVSEETAVSKSGKIYRKFRDEKSVWDLLNLMTRSDDYENDKREFPFSTIENVDTFNHTFWLIPSVESAIALEEMLSRHPVFRHYAVVNVTADNFEGDSALAAVQKSIKENEKTITLSYGRLTTGVTVPEWNGVLLMSNLKSPMTYMQTIFRVKSGGILQGGKTKDKGYVFDFAPDRTLTMVAHASQLTRDSDEEKREAVEELLQYMPIVSDAGSRFQKFDTDALMRTLNRVYISKAVNSGFETSLLYNLDAHKISSEDVEKFMKLQKTVGKHTSTNSKSVKISESQLSENDASVLKKKRSDLESPGERKEWSEADKAKKADAENRKAIVKVLNSVSVRIPLMVFASPPATKVNIHNLTDLIDDKSWEEFMPKGFTKDGESSSWESIKGFYDKTVFEGACEEICDRVRRMDDMAVLERVAAVARIFSTFKNPDKETVLTPWSAVNRQYAVTLGGLRWTDDAGKWYCSDGNSYSLEEIDDLELKIEPIWVESDEGMEDFWKSADTSTIDINSKTALYPLFSAASMFYSQKLERARIEKPLSDTVLWRQIVTDQIYVNCRVPYSKSIAQRVLLGYGSSEVNASVIDVLDIRRKLIDSKAKKEDQEAIWKWLFNPKNLHRATERANEVLTSENLKEIVEAAQATEADGFSAVASNPPYQVNTGGEKNSAAAIPVWQEFLIISSDIASRVSFINPARWQKGGAGTGLTEIREWFAKNPHLKFFYNLRGEDTFPNTGIAGGVCIEFLDNTKKFDFPLFQKWDKENGWSSEQKYDFNASFDIFIEDERDRKIIKAITSLDLSSVEKRWWQSGENNFVKKKSPFFNDGHGQHEYGLNTARVREDTNYFIHSTPTNKSDFVKIFHSPSNGEIKECWLDKKELKETVNNSSRIPFYKIFIPKSGAECLYRNKTIFANEDSIATSSWLGIVLNEKELDGFYSYLNTYFYRFLVSLRRVSLNAYANIHRWVPDITTLENPRTKKIGYLSDWTDDDLREAFGNLLTEDDWLHIKATAIAADGGKGDYENGYKLPKPYGWTGLNPEKIWNGSRKSLSI